MKSPEKVYIVYQEYTARHSKKWPMIPTTEYNICMSVAEVAEKVKSPDAIMYTMPLDLFNIIKDNPDAILYCCHEYKSYDGMKRFEVGHVLYQAATAGQEVRVQ